MAEENSGKPQLGDSLKDTRQVIAYNKVPVRQMSSAELHSTSWCTYFTAEETAGTSATERLKAVRKFKLGEKKTKAEKELGTIHRRESKILGNGIKTRKKMP